MTGAFAAGALGALLGLLGHVLLTPSGEGVSSVVWVIGGAALVAVAITEVVARGRWLPQLPLQTNRAWSYHPPSGWAIRVGAFLGLGGLSRVSFATWYVVPTVAFLSRSAAVGALCFGSYGLARLALSLLLFDRRDPFREPSLGLALLRQEKRPLHLLSALATVSVGIGLAANGGL